MPALDPTLLAILNNRPDAMQSLLPIASAFAHKHMMEMAHEQDMVDRAKKEGDERAQREAVHSPYVRGLLRQSTAPVTAFDPTDPQSLAPGAGADVGTLQSAMPPMGGPAGIPQTGARGMPSPSGAAMSPSPFDNMPVPQGGQGAMPPVAGSGIDELTLTSGPFTPPPDQRAQTLIPYRDDSAFSSSDLGRRALPNRAQDKLRRQPSGEEPQTPEELAAGKDALKLVATRRNTEETSRRQLQVEDLKGKNKGRDSQLTSATKLLMNLRDNATKMAVELEKAKAIMAKKAKTGQDLKSLKDGWNLAREHADAAKSAVAMLYQGGAAGAAEGSPEAQNYQEALKESRRALTVAGEWERAYTDSVNDVKNTPKVGGMPGKKTGAAGGVTPTGRTKTDKNGTVWEEMSDGSARQRA